MLDEYKEPLFPPEKDFTRPIFERKTGEIGIFIDVYDAIPINKEVFGSPQYFLMNLKDRFYEEVSRGELFKIKGFFYKRKLMNDITIEGFLPGTLLIVYTNSQEGLNNMMNDYESGKLNQAFVECFVTEKLEKKIEVTNLKLKIKIFLDEVNSTLSEWEQKELPEPYLISTSEKDIRMIYIIKKFQQKVLIKRLNKLKDLALQFEATSLEFLQYLKQHCGIKQEEIKNILDATNLCKMFSNNRDAQLHLHLFQNYFSIISEIKETVRDIETHVLFPLKQIRLGCENINQLEVNKKMQNQIDLLKSALKEKSSFKFYNSHIEIMIPKNDRQVWGGMIYLIPASVSIINDIDQQIDNYFQLGNFNQILKEYENKMKK